MEHSHLTAEGSLRSSRIPVGVPFAGAKKGEGIEFSNGLFWLNMSQAKKRNAPLRPFLQGHSSVMVGQSGMGKSTFINALLPDAQVSTREISKALNSGKHTTTHARLYHLNESSHLIDCPGVQVFGLHHLDFGEIEEGFVEFAPYRGHCRYNNCRHTHEPNCALKQAVESGAINARRMQLFQEISQQTNRANHPGR